MNRIALDDPRDFLLYREGSGGTIEIYDVEVGSARRQGRGRELVERLFSLVQSDTNLVWAVTRINNEIAQQWYESMGFRVVGVLRRFYDAGGEGVDAIMYGRSPRGPV